MLAVVSNIIVITDFVNLQYTCLSERPYTALYSWWWVELSPESCRVKPLRRINAFVASCWIYFTRERMCIVVVFSRQSAQRLNCFLLTQPFANPSKGNVHFMLCFALRLQSGVNRTVVCLVCWMLDVTVLTSKHCRSRILRIRLQVEDR